MGFLKDWNPITGKLNPLKTTKDNWVDFRDTLSTLALPGTSISAGDNGLIGDSFSAGSSFADAMVPQRVQDLALAQDWTLREGANQAADDPWWALTHRDRLITPMGSASDSLYDQYEAETGGDATRAKTFGKIGDSIAGIFAGGTLGELSGLSSTFGSGAEGMQEAFSGGSAMGAGETGAGGGLLEGAGGAASQAANLGSGLLQPPEQPPPPQPMQPMQQDPQAQQRRAALLQQEMQIQALRQKPNKTPEEWAMLKQMSEQRGLLGGYLA
jgi:hypothetical protein